MRIIVAYDGSPCADAALIDLHRAGLHREAEVLAITVAERWLPRPFLVGQAVEPRLSAAVATAPETAEDFKRAFDLACQAKLLLQSYFKNWRIEALSATG
jgi:hypothetical protein